MKGYVVGALRRECETSSLMKEYIVNNGKKKLNLRTKSNVRCKDFNIHCVQT